MARHEVNKLYAEDRNYFSKAIEIMKDCEMKATENVIKNNIQDKYIDTLLLNLMQNDHKIKEEGRLYGYGKKIIKKCLIKSAKKIRMQSSRIC